MIFKIEIESLYDEEGQRIYSYGLREKRVISVLTGRGLERRLHKIMYDADGRQLYKLKSIENISNSKIV